MCGCSPPPVKWPCCPTRTMNCGWSSNASVEQPGKNGATVKEDSVLRNILGKAYLVYWEVRGLIAFIKFSLRGK